MYDDGGNFDTMTINIRKDYKNHNDYILVDQLLVSFLALYRTAVTDLQAPTYDYWGSILDSNLNK